MTRTEVLRSYRPSSRPLLILVVGLLGLSPLALLSGCSKHEEGKKEAPTPVPVRVAQAEKRSLRPSFEVIGMVVADPERVATLAAPIPGLVSKLAVPEGTKVKPGDLIIQLDEQKARYDVDRAKAAYDRLLARPWEEEIALARSAVEKAQAAHALAQARLKGAQELRAQSSNLVPELQLKEHQSGEQAARAELAAAEAQFQLMKKEVRAAQERELLADWKNAELQLHWCRVTTPLLGEVSEIKARVGQRADAGTPLATVMDISEVLVQARVPSNRLSSVVHAVQNKGQRTLAQVRCPSFPETLFPSTSGWLSQQTEGMTSDVPIKLRVANPGGLLRVGMTVQLELFEADVEDLAIPEAAFTVNEEGKYVVTAIRDGKAVPTEIELAPEGGAQVRAGGWVRVVKGPQPGDTVAIENGYALPDGTPVLVLPPREPEPKHP